MPIYPIKEFAELCNLEPKQIHTYASRGKIIKTSDSRIDSTNALNKLFLEQRQKDNVKEQSTKKESKSRPKNHQKKESESDISRSNILVNLELEKKRLEVEKLKKDNEIKEQELKKRKGELVDLAETLKIISNYSDSLKREFADNTRRLIKDICVRYNIPGDKSADYELKIIDIINNCNSNSLNELRQNIISK